MKIFILILLSALIWFLNTLFFNVLMGKTEKTFVMILCFAASMLIVFSGVIVGYKLAEYWDMVAQAKVVLGIGVCACLFTTLIYDRIKK